MTRLVTVTGSRTNTLRHFFSYYENLVDEIYVVVYEWEGSSTYNEVEIIAKDFPNVKIVDRLVAEKYNWEIVTSLYNKTKMLHPNDWWVVADDDEFHEYSKDIDSITEECELNGWELVRGGFIGSHMVKRLRKEGYWVRGVDLKYPEFSISEVNGN